MRWYFFAGFAAAIICAVLGTALIIFTIATSRLWTMRAVAILAPLPFCLWGARELRAAFQGKDLDN